MVIAVNSDRLYELDHNKVHDLDVTSVDHGTYIAWAKYGRAIIVRSIDDSKPHLSVNTCRKKISNVDVKKYRTISARSTLKNLLSQIRKRNFKAVGVIIDQQRFDSLRKPSMKKMSYKAALVWREFEYKSYVHPYPMMYVFVFG